MAIEVSELINHHRLMGALPHHC